MSSVTMPAQPFDVAGLRDALPAVTTATPVPAQRTQMGGAAGAAWAGDFLAGQPATTTQAQGIPAMRVEQQNRVRGPASPIGGMQSASACLHSPIRGFC